MFNRTRLEQTQAPVEASDHQGKGGTQAPVEASDHQGKGGTQAPVEASDHQGKGEAQAPYEAGGTWVWGTPSIGYRSLRVPAAAGSVTVLGPSGKLRIKQLKLPLGER